MVAIYVQKTVHEGLWSRRIALFFVQLLILTVLLHRFGTLATPAALNLMAVSIGGLLLAIFIAVFALVRIWFGGQHGAGQAFAAIGIALAGLAAPAFFLAHALYLPKIYDVETTPSEPIQFKQLATLRPSDANRLEDPDAAAAAAQEAAYPDIEPMRLERSSAETFDLVHEAVKRLGWTIVTSEAPAENSPGLIEATDRTMILGFTDDIAIRVSGDDTNSRIDIRSVSRYGPHDLGANADRIRAFFAEIKATLEKGEKTSLEQAEPPTKAKAAKPTLKQKQKARAERRNRRSTTPAPPPQQQRPIFPFFR